jgi:hypothetical protein
LPDGVAKAHALDVAFVKHLEGCDHASLRLIRLGAAGNRVARFIVRAQGRANRDRANLRAEGSGEDRWN